MLLKSLDFRQWLAQKRLNAVKKTNEIKIFAILYIEHLTRFKTLASLLFLLYLPEDKNEYGYAIMKRVILFLFFIQFQLYVIAARNETSSCFADSLLSFSKTLLGKPYKSGGKGPAFFDCSGYTGYVFSKFGYNLNSSSSSQYLQGEGVKLSELGKCDLVFFNGRNSGGIGHVGIVCEVDSAGFYFIHATTQKGVMIDRYPDSEYYRKRYVGARRILHAEGTRSIDVVPDSVCKNDSVLSVVDTARVENVENIEVETKPIFHIVQKGETLYRISKKYGVELDSVMKWNELSDYGLSIGQKLEIRK